MKFLKRNYLFLLAVITFFIKLPFIFHGTWDNIFFTPYMTDETVYLSPIINNLSKGADLELEGLLHSSYPPFIFNLLFPYFKALFIIFNFLSLKLNLIQINQIVYYNSRLFVLIITTLGTYFYVKTFSEILKSKLYKVFLLFVISFSPLIFFHSIYLKTDNLVWGIGAISLYLGLNFYKKPTLSKYLYFFFSALLPSIINYYGAIYFLHFAFITILTFKNNFLKSIYKIGFIIFIAPLFWLLLNFQLIFNANILSFEISRYTTSISEKTSKVSILENLNNYSAFNFYLDYLNGYLVSYFLALFVAVFFLIKIKNNYFRSLFFTLTIFFVQISVASYRTDRLLLPIFVFLLSLVIFLFDFLYFKSKKALRLVLPFVSIIFVLYIIGPTIKFAQYIPNKDTRQLAYEYIQQNLPIGSNIYIPHLTIASAFNTGQRLSLENHPLFDIKIIDLSHYDSSAKGLDNIKGYFILSLEDYNVIQLNKNTDLYKNQYQSLEKLISRSQEIVRIDRINYFKNPFGPRNLFPNSLYGIHNPSLIIYKTDNTPLPLTSSQLEDFPRPLAIKNIEKIINIDIKNLAVKEIGQNAIDEGGGRTDKTLKIKNDSQGKITLEGVYLGENLGFGFYDKKLSGKHFLFTTWVKSSNKNCIIPSFYRGNSSSIAWGRPNIATDSNKYELIFVEGYFDSPYSLNGNVFYKINPSCQIEISQPQLTIIND